MTRNHRNFRKSDLSERVAQFGRPCRWLTLAGFAPNCSRAALMIYMTRRAFLSLRVLNIYNTDTDFFVVCLFTPPVFGLRCALFSCYLVVLKNITNFNVF